MRTSTIFVCLIFIVSASHLRFSEIPDKDDQLSDLCISHNIYCNYVVCGAFRTRCENTTLEEHIYFAEFGEYPTNFTRKWLFYSTGTCDFSNLMYEIHANASLYVI